MLVDPTDRKNLKTVQLKWEKKHRLARLIRTYSTAILEAIPLDTVRMTKPLEDRLMGNETYWGFRDLNSVE